MRTHQIVSGYVSGLLALPEEVDSTAAQAAGRALPGGWRLAPPRAGTGKAAVEIAFGAAGITADAHTVRLRLPRRTAASDTLAYVTYTALERTRQQQRMVTVHATAMHMPSGQAVLLLGANGAGKTSTALALAERGWVHAGDDLVVLADRDDGTLAVWPGKPNAAIRDPHRSLEPKSLRDLAPFAAGPAPLGWAVRVAVHPSLPGASLTPAVPLSVNERLRLHEGLARYISGLPTPLTGVSGTGVSGTPYGPVWPLDTPACARWRSGIIAMLEDCRFDYLYAPDAEAAADLLTKRVAVS